MFLFLFRQRVQRESTANLLSPFPQEKGYLSRSDRRRRRLGKTLLREDAPPFLRGFWSVYPCGPHAQRVAPWGMLVWRQRDSSRRHLQHGIEADDIEDGVLSQRGYR